jgi:hypothetical protein
MSALSDSSPLDVLFNQRQPIGDKFLNSILIEQQVQTLRMQGGDIDDLSSELLLKEHGLHIKSRELTTDIYSQWSRVGPLEQTPPGFLQACGPISKFRFVCNGQQEIDLRVTYRIPACSSAANVPVLLNCRNVGMLDNVSRWTTRTITIPATHLRAGFNYVEVRWPLPTASLSERIEQVANAMEDQSVPRITPIFGEIYSLEVGQTNSAVTESRKSEAGQDMRSPHPHLPDPITRHSELLLKSL